MVSEVVDMCSTSQPDPADPTAAESFKEEGNECFKVGKYQEAVSLYTKAIDLNAAEATYYGNRSFAHLKTEMYGLALADATKSIQLDGTYMKGYYRRAAAHMALGKFKVALKDFKTVLTARPNDPDAKAKFRECEKITKQKAFEKAIAVESCTKSVGETIDLDAMTIDDDYSGPQLENGKVTEKFMTELISTFKKQERLHKRFAYKILLDVEALLKSQPSLVDIKIAEVSFEMRKAQKFTICGDVHGQFYDLLNIFELNGLPSAQNPYLFNGDFVDRGSFSVECIFTLFGFKVLYPEHFFLARGNHESKIMNSMYGFEGEVRSKYSAEMAELFTEIFNWLPLAHLINSTVLVMHGGLFADDGVKLDDIRLVDRNKQPPDSGIMCDLLWSDPQPQNGRSPSKRGVGIQFGPDVTKRFCLENGLQYIVRSHEVKQEGYEVSHDERCVTVFSAPNYCDMMGNKGAFINIRGDNFKPVFTSYEAVNHPSVRPMAYANSLFGF